jgi:hypothetical protein
LQLTLQAPLHIAVQPALSLFASHLASHSPLQSPRHAASQSNLPGSTVHCPVQSATHLPLQSTLGSLSQLASQLAASFALQAARTLIGVHMTSQLAVGGTTLQSTSASRLISPQSDRSARAVLGALAIPKSAAALKHDTTERTFVGLSIGRRLSVSDATAAEQKSCQPFTPILNTARKDQ